MRSIHKYLGGLVSLGIRDPLGVFNDKEQLSEQGFLTEYLTPFRQLNLWPPWVGAEKPQSGEWESFGHFKRCYDEQPDESKCVRLEGTGLQKAISTRIQSQSAHLFKERLPKLVAILVGDNPASHVYVSHKKKFFLGSGLDAETLHLPAHTTQCELSKVIQELNVSQDVDGILVQLPLPVHINEKYILNAIAPHKDVDGFHAHNAGLLAQGLGDGFIPCTPLGVALLLSSYGVSLRGRKVAIVGRSRIVGRPFAALALALDAVTLQLHSAAKGPLGSHLQQADVIVAAAGVRGLIEKSMVKPGAIVVDVGIHRSTEDGKLYGDVRSDVRHVAAAVTPVPGGVGPMTIACLALNTILAWHRCRLPASEPHIKGV